jgi:hypothetical protein
LKQAEMWKLTARERGRRGYLATTAKMGQFEFHSAGGQKTAGMDLFMCHCHGVGVQAYSQHFKLKGKKHRYG